MKLSGLFLKIFFLLWLAQSLIFVISTSQIVRQRFPGPNTLADALDSNLHFNAADAIRAFDAGGCAAFSSDRSGRHEPSGAMLLRSDGTAVCSTSSVLTLPGLVPHFPDRVEGREVQGKYVWLIPVVSNTGERLEYVWFQPPQMRPVHKRSLLHYAFPQLPVAIVISGLATFALMVLFSRPLVRLRKAASAMSEGDLSVRVDETPTKLLRSRPDEFQSLTRDFNHMAERLESLVAAQRTLLRDVSHELRSPLSRLSVALELARVDAGTGMESHFARIEREADKLNQLIGELLALSAMESASKTREFTAISLNRLCEQLLPDAEFEAQRRPCRVVLRQEADCSVNGDRTLLHRAIENVVRNAIRYTEPGTEVTLRLRNELADGAHCAVLEVVDHGPGIPEEELERIFKPFVRLDQARSANTGGFGVGLAITERAMRFHKGQARAMNNTEGGLTVILTLPLQSIAAGRRSEDQLR